MEIKGWPVLGYKEDSFQCSCCIALSGWNPLITDLRKSKVIRHNFMRSIHRNSQLFRNVLYYSFSVSRNECINWIHHFRWACCILPLDLDKQCIYKNIISYLYSSTVTCVWSMRAVWESSYTRRSCRESKQPTRSNFSQNSRPYIVLKYPCDSRACASSPTQYLFFIGHGLHPRNPCSPLVTAFTPSHCLFSASHFVYVSIENIHRLNRKPKKYITCLLL